ncbi:Tetratricopeptide-like helical [Penicillium cf. griseofulvum]|uniref:Tetratricopeptide-like helical n=1 Tax=Penicillium cf. griseofulvum TaxID=2972120 RepID=A0A9W9MZA4_9EURO|nr:Tetratricopeptide-like helical [Penicillium cf. griseofulvum]KAJ5421549.1 Tetratricopeptide-like helical [Penicillium cf. griseofulvum]
MDELQEAVRLAQTALDATPEHHPDLPLRLGSLAYALAAQYNRTGNLEDLQEAVRLSRAAVNATPDDDPDLPHWIGELGTHLLARHSRTGDLSDLQDAVDLIRRCVDGTPKDNEYLATRLNSLANALSARYDRIGNLEDLQEAIVLARRAIDITPEDDPDLPDWLNGLALALSSRYSRIGNWDDLQEAVRLHRKSVDSTEKDDPGLPNRLRNLAANLSTQYGRTSKLEYLNEAIRLNETAVDATPEDHPDLPSQLSNLSEHFSSRYSHTGNSEDLHKAIRLVEAAVDGTPKDHPELAARLGTLATYLSTRYEGLGDPDDLHQAIQTGQKAIDITPKDHPDLAFRLSSLAGIFSIGYEQAGNFGDLQEALRLGKMSVDLTPKDHAKLASRLNDLGIYLSTRYDRTGDLNDLQQAIRLGKRAVSTTPPDNHPDIALFSITLATNLSTRYDRTGDLDDLHEAVRLAKEVIDIIPDDHPDVEHWLHSLSVFLSTRYHRTGDVEDLQEAVRLAKNAVATTPEGHPDLENRLLNMASNLATRFERSETSDLDDIQQAVQLTQRAVDGTPEDNPDLPHWLNNLAIYISKRYNRTGNLVDLQEAIPVAQKAVDHTPEDHPDLAPWLNNLAIYLSIRYEHTHQQNDKAAALKHFSQSLDSNNAAPRHRIEAARRAIDLLVPDGDFDRAQLLAGKSLDLLPLVCSRYLAREDQQYAIQQMSGLAADASSLLLRTDNDPARALEYLEHGRGLIIGYLIDSRGDISDLSTKHPKEADKFDRLRHKAFMPIRQEDPVETRRQFLEERADAVTRLESCLEDIRRLEGFDRFLLPPSSEALQANATDGPIVVVNVTSISSDALIVRPSGIKHIPLPDFDISKANNYRSWGLTRSPSRLIELKEKGGPSSFERFLRDLWSDCVRLVLDELGFLHPASDTLPRIWWIGTGLAASLPFHAAGDHSPGSLENTLSCVLSSYTPSIKMLQFAREKTRVTLDTQSMLLVTMPKTPGEDDLPGVTAESQAIQEAVVTPHTVKLLIQPSAEIVLHGLQDCSIAHFACHGSSDMSDPSNSFLALQGQDSVDRLTVKKISESHMKEAWLAYLSACSTAENQTSELADEALHLASGFQVAGFAHTVGSMWSSNDEICVQVAAIFYRELITGGLVEGNRAVATALHTAVMTVREQNLERPYLWAQYVHFGA